MNVRNSLFLHTFSPHAAVWTVPHLSSTVKLNALCPADILQVLNFGACGLPWPCAVYLCTTLLEHGDFDSSPAGVPPLINVKFMLQLQSPPAAANWQAYFIFFLNDHDRDESFGSAVNSIACSGSKSSTALNVCTCMFLHKSIWLCSCCINKKVQHTLLDWISVVWYACSYFCIWWLFSFAVTNRDWSQLVFTPLFFFATFLPTCTCTCPFLPYLCACVCLCACHCDNTDWQVSPAGHLVMLRKETQTVRETGRRTGGKTCPVIIATRFTSSS